MNNLTVDLRRVCGHDSRSVDGCLHCEAADYIEDAVELVAALKANERGAYYDPGSEAYAHYQARRTAERERFHTALARLEVRHG